MSAANPSYDVAMSRSEPPVPAAGDPESGPSAPDPPRIVLFSWCPGATMYLDALAAAGAPPRLVVTGTSPAPGALSGACARIGAILESCADVNDPAFVDRVAAAQPDLLIVAGCSQILGEPLLRAPKLGAVNLHPSLLPKDRGREPLFWAILRGDRSVGITAHRMTKFVDAGPILLQRSIAVPERATSASLARIVDQEGAELVATIVAMARAGALPEGRLPIEPGSRVPPLRPEHGLCDWARSAEEIDRLVRACAGEIRAYTFFDGMRLYLLEAQVAPRERPAQRHSPGTILAIATADDALTIAAAEGAILATRWLFMDRVHRGAELAAALGLRPGDRFTANPAFLRGS
jgi:methionyl-tRNA formyltransferase